MLEIYHLPVDFYPILPSQPMSTLTHEQPTQGNRENVIRFRAGDELYERVRIEAIKGRISVQHICISALMAYLAEQGKSAKIPQFGDKNDAKRAVRKR